MALRSLGYDTQTQHCAHGFRSSTSSMLHELGKPSQVIELQLAHKDQNEVRRIYNRSERLQERRELMQEWADYMDRLTAGQTGPLVEGEEVPSENRGHDSSVPEPVLPREGQRAERAEWPNDIVEITRTIVLFLIRPDGGPLKTDALGTEPAETISQGPTKAPLTRISLPSGGMGSSARPSFPQRKMPS